MNYVFSTYLKTEDKKHCMSTLYFLQHYFSNFSIVYFYFNYQLFTDSLLAVPFSLAFPNPLLVSKAIILQ